MIEGILYTNNIKRLTKKRLSSYSDFMKNAISDDRAIQIDHLLRTSGPTNSPIIFNDCCAYANKCFDDPISIPKDFVYATSPNLLKLTFTEKDNELYMNEGIFCLGLELYLFSSREKSTNLADGCLLFYYKPTAAIREIIL